MKTKLVILALLCMLGACRKQDASKPSGQQTIRFQSTVRVAANIEATVTDIKDSRCPKNAVCVQMGSAVVTCQFSDGSESVSTTLELSPVKIMNPTIITLSGHSYQVSLLEVLPYPESGKNVPLEDYSIKIAVDKQ